MLHFDFKAGGAPDCKASAIQIDVKAVEDDGTFTGYGSTFDNLDSGGDIVLPGAFRNTLAKRKLPQIKMLRDHDSTKIVGQWVSLAEDDRGLKCTGRLFKDEVPLARETYALMKAGALDALSIGYRTVKAQWDEVGESRKIAEVDLWEISVVPFPMNEQATVDMVKGVFTERDIERALREAGVPGQFAKLVTTHGYPEASKRTGSHREGGSDADFLEALGGALQQIQKGIRDAHQGTDRP